MPVAAHRLRACRRAMAHRRRRFADLAIPLTPMLTHILTWVIDATDFRPSRSGGSTVPVAAHSLQACRRAMAHRRRRFADLDRVISAPSVVARILARARGATDFRPSRSGGATVPVAAHSLRACRRAMAHRRRRFADLAIPLTPMLACILAWAREGTDFRPSITGVGGACASGRTVWESGRERWRDGAGIYRTLRFGPTSVVARILAWAREGTDFRPSINGDAIVNVEHVPHAVHTSTRSGTSTKDVIRASPTLGNWKSESEPTPRAAAVRRYDPQPC